MNIFVLDLDPKRCARYHCDFHVGKMITETAQILSTVLGGPYKPTHVSHPCVKWAEGGIDNVAWLLALGEALGNEFKFRRCNKHASSLVIDEIARRFAPHLAGNIKLPTRFALAMPEHLRRSALTAPPERAVERYRAYYNECKQGFWRRTGQWVPATWGKREVPEWFVRAQEPSSPPTD